MASVKGMAEAVLLMGTSGRKGLAYREAFRAAQRIGQREGIEAEKLAAKEYHWRPARPARR